MSDANSPEPSMPPDETPTAASAGAALPPGSAAAAPGSAGAMLRAAREAQGLHIAALAAAIKVTPRKLEALESDRLSELPDATFARALAQTICRHLKTDAKPILALLPAHGAVSLEPSSRIASTPYRERNSRAEQSAAASSLGPLVWGAALLLVAAAVLALAPPGWWNLAPAELNTAPLPAVVAAPAGVPPAAASAALPAPSAGPAAAAEAPQLAGSAAAGVAAVSAASAAPLPSAAPAGAAPASPTTTMATVAGGAAPAAARDAPSSAETVFSTPPAAPDAAPSVAGALVVTTTDASWVEVRDARGRTLLSEIVQPGRTVGVDGPRPLRLLVGNAAATQLVFMGRPVDVLARSRENVARFELQ